MGTFSKWPIKLAAWASLSTKPLSLRGAWAGLKYLEKLYSLLLPNMAQRDQIPISKPSGKCLICVWIEYLDLPLCFVLYFPHHCFETTLPLLGMLFFTPKPSLPEVEDIERVHMHLCSVSSCLWIQCCLLRGLGKWLGLSFWWRRGLGSWGAECVLWFETCFR